MQTKEKTIEHDLRLPNKFSDVIMVALEDLALTEKDDRYFVDMGTYHSNKLGFLKYPKCRVCFAGGIMAQCETTDINAVYDTGSFRHDRFKLKALDHIRNYDYCRAITCFYHDIFSADNSRYLSDKETECLLALNEHFMSDEIFNYDESPYAFKINMETISAIMAEHGL